MIFFTTDKNSCNCNDCLLDSYCYSCNDYCTFVFICGQWLYWGSMAGHISNGHQYLLSWYKLRSPFFQFSQHHQVGVEKEAEKDIFVVSAINNAKHHPCLLYMREYILERNLMHAVSVASVSQDAIICQYIREHILERNLTSVISAASALLRLETCGPIKLLIIKNYLMS